MEVGDEVGLIACLGLDERWLKGGRKKVVRAGLYFLMMGGLRVGGVNVSVVNKVCRTEEKVKGMTIIEC